MSPSHEPSFCSGVSEERRHQSKSTASGALPRRRYAQVHGPNAFQKEMEASQNKRSAWPYAIGGYFVLFGAAMTAWIVFAVHQKMDLVRKDYYAEELRFQQHLERSNRAQAIRGEIQAAYNAAAQAIDIALPTKQAGQNISGRIHLYRPSDASLDRSFALSPKLDGTQRLDTKTLRPGLWRLRVEWTSAGEEYCFDQPLVIGGI